MCRHPQLITINYCRVTANVVDSCMFLYSLKNLIVKLPQEETKPYLAGGLELYTCGILHKTDENKSFLVYLP